MVHQVFVPLNLMILPFIILSQSICLIQVINEPRDRGGLELLEHFQRD
jgi:hypothetical protein